MTDVITKAMATLRHEVHEAETIDDLVKFWDFGMELKIIADGCIRQKMVEAFPARTPKMITLEDCKKCKHSSTCSLHALMKSNNTPILNCEFSLKEEEPLKHSS